MADLRQTAAELEALLDVVRERERNLAQLVDLAREARQLADGRIPLDTQRAEDTLLEAEVLKAYFENPLPVETPPA